MKQFVDWGAVEMVVSGASLALKPMEKKMAMRRLAERMRHDVSCYGRGIPAEEIARRLGCSERSVVRLAAGLPDADKTTCPVCHEPMWVVAGRVEAHPDRLAQECPMSDQLYGPQGLARVRPDLYQWLEGVAV